MKVGDSVIRIANGQIGLVIEKHRLGNFNRANGDFTISYKYKVLFDSVLYLLPSRSIEVISESR